MQGYLVINCIIGGQALATVSDKLTDTLGIVIISLISLAVSTIRHMAFLYLLIWTRLHSVVTGFFICEFHSE